MSRVSQIIETSENVGSMPPYPIVLECHPWSMPSYSSALGCYPCHPFQLQFGWHRSLNYIPSRALLRMSGMPITRGVIWALSARYPGQQNKRKYTSSVASSCRMLWQRKPTSGDFMCHCSPCLWLFAHCAMRSLPKFGERNCQDCWVFIVLSRRKLNQKHSLTNISSVHNVNCFADEFG